MWHPRMPKSRFLASYENFWHPKTFWHPPDFLAYFGILNFLGKSWNFMYCEVPKTIKIVDRDKSRNLCFLLVPQFISRWKAFKKIFHARKKLLAENVKIWILFVNKNAIKGARSWMVGLKMGFRNFGIFWHPNFQILASWLRKNLATLFVPLLNFGLSITFYPNTSQLILTAINIATI